MKRLLMLTFVSVTIIGSEHNVNQSKNYTMGDFKKGFFGNTNLVLVKNFDSKASHLETPIIPIHCVCDINPDDSIKVNIVHGFSTHYGQSRQKTLLTLLEQYSPKAAQQVHNQQKQLADFLTYTTDSFVDRWSRREKFTVDVIRWKIKGIKFQASITECAY